MAGPWGLGPELQRGAKVAWAALSGRVLGGQDHWLFTRAAALGRAVLRLR